MWNFPKDQEAKFKALVRACQEAGSDPVASLRVELNAAVRRRNIEFARTSGMRVMATLNAPLDKDTLERLWYREQLRTSLPDVAFEISDKRVQLAYKNDMFQNHSTEDIKRHFESAIRHQRTPDKIARARTSEEALRTDEASRGGIKPPSPGTLIERFNRMRKNSSERRALGLEIMKQTRWPESTFYHHARMVEEGACDPDGPYRRLRKDKGTTKYPGEREKLVAILKANPSLTIREAARRADMPYPAARRATRHL